MSESVIRLNLGAGKSAKPRAEGWLNVDKFEYPTTDEVEYRKLDLFRYPWDLPDNSVDEVFASHIIEHIPHEAKPNDDYLDEMYLDGRFSEYGSISSSELTRRQDRWNELKNLDGFFAFFAEVWRVCKPDAIVNILCPFGYSRGSFQDPTHTRYIVPPTFYYLTSEENAQWDYHLPLKFKILECNMAFEPEALMQMQGMAKADRDWLASHEWDVFRDLTAKLQVIK